MKEYKVIEKTKSELQKVLNQWKHDYFIMSIELQVVVHTEISGCPTIYHAVIERVPKGWD